MQIITRKCGDRLLTFKNWKPTCYWNNSLGQDCEIIPKILHQNACRTRTTRKTTAPKQKLKECRCINNRQTQTLSSLLLFKETLILFSYRIFLMEIYGFFESVMYGASNFSRIWWFIFLINQTLGTCNIIIKQKIEDFEAYGGLCGHIRRFRGPAGVLGGRWCRRQHAPPHAFFFQKRCRFL